MGKGKKKGSKKEVAPSLSSLTVSEQPSTSQAESLSQQPASIAQTSQEELSIKQTKKEQKDIEPREVETKVEPKDVEQMVISEKEEGGLGIEKAGRKRKPRKKKFANEPVEETTIESTSESQLSLQSSLKKGEGDSKVELVYFGSQAIGSQPLRGQTPPLPQTGPQQFHRAPTTQMASPPSFWNRPPTSGEKPRPQVTQTQSQIGQTTSVRGQAPSMGQAPSLGRGRSRGQAPPMGQFTQPSLQDPSQMHPQHGYCRGQGPSAQMPTRPGLTQDQSGPPIPGPSKPQQTAPATYKASQSVKSDYKIPTKIIGSSVPARNITVVVNYLPMVIKNMKIHRYDVIIKPDKPKKMMPKAFAAVRNAHFQQNLIAFDQIKNCYSLKPLAGISQHERSVIKVDVMDNDNKKMAFEVSFKYTGLVDFQTILSYMATGGTSLNPPAEAIQCIDVILRQGTLESYVKCGRQFFKRPSRPIYLGDGLEMWTGLFQSAIFTSRAFINVDVAHKGFPIQQSMIDVIVNEFRMDPKQPLERQRGYEYFSSFIKNLKVVAIIGGDTSSTGKKREFICNGIVDPANRLTFDMTEGDKTQKLTVSTYFEKYKKYRLKYPYLNCMWVGPRNKNLYFPMELLEVAYGQILKKQLNENQLSKMVREAATPPNIRKQKIEEVIRDMNYSRNKFFKDFGLEISDQFLEVEAKVLRPPIMQVGGGKTVEPRRGVWQANTVLQPEALISWGFIAIESGPDQCNYNGIINMIMRNGNQMGMRVLPPKCTHFNVRMNQLLNILFTALQKEINFLFIVVSRRGRDDYHRVKRMAELEVGILTQCIKEYTAANKMNDATVRNILLKVNSKLMGINQALDGRCMPNCLKGNVMVVGADVTHPSPDQSNVPSIAAVTASIDLKCFQYNIEMSVQTPKKEIIVEFEDIMVEHLQVYKKHQNTLPKKIFVFRDGVSEGQFAEVMNSELTAVHRAYQRMTGTSQKPEVLFLLVQKRHHTRLFSGPQNPQNVEPGTVVDKHIVHARELDFYLVSHQAIKGTARPTRYHAVCNDGGIPHDEVEQLTYYLCHLYSRCMRSVSYPTPTYYAHLACLRAKSLTYGDTFDNEALERKPQRLNVLKKMLDFSRMFFV